MEPEKPGPLLAEPNDTALMTSHPDAPASDVAHGDFGIKTMPFVVHNPHPTAPVPETNESVEHDESEDHEHPEHDDPEHAEAAPAAPTSMLDGDSMLAYGHEGTGMGSHSALFTHLPSIGGPAGSGFPGREATGMGSMHYEPVDGNAIGSGDVVAVMLTEPGMSMDPDAPDGVTMHGANLSLDTLPIVPVVEVPPEPIVEPIAQHDEVQAEETHEEQTQHDESMHNEPVHEEPVHVHEDQLHELEAMHNEPVHDEPVHDETPHSSSEPTAPEPVIMHGEMHGEMRGEMHSETPA